MRINVKCWIESDSKYMKSALIKQKDYLLEILTKVCPQLGIFRLDFYTADLWQTLFSVKGGDIEYLQ